MATVWVEFHGWSFDLEEETLEHAETAIKAWTAYAEWLREYGE